MPRIVPLMPLVLALAACGRVGFTPVSGDGAVPGGDDAVGEDAAPGPPACQTFGPWSAPQLLAAIASTASDRGGEVTADGRGFYFNSNRSGTERFYVARRSDRVSPWQAPQVLPELDAAFVRTDITITGDEREVFFTASPPGAGDCIYRAARTDVTQPFGPIAPQSALCAAVKTECPHVSTDGLTLTYSSNDTLQIATRPDRDAEFPLGTAIPGLDLGINCPYLTDDQLALYYERNGFEIELTTRTTTSEAFAQPPQLLPAIDADQANEDVSLTRDGLELYWGSNRPGVGDYDPYVTTRACLDP